MRSLFATINWLCHDFLHHHLFNMENHLNKNNFELLLVAQSYKAKINSSINSWLNLNTKLSAIISNYDSMMQTKYNDNESKIWIAKFHIPYTSNFGKDKLAARNNQNERWVTFHFDLLQDDKIQLIRLSWGWRFRSRPMYFKISSKWLVVCNI